MKRHLNLATSQLNSTTRQKCNYDPNGLLPPVYQVNSCEQVKQRIITVRVRKQVVGGALSYADDITLLCPSIRGLNKMLDICNSFADMYDIKFNAKKSLGIKFGGQQVMSEVLYLGNSRIEWVSSVKHLGNYVNSDMTDKTDCDMKCSSFIGYVNKLKANFGYLQPFVLGNLFKTFCCSFYGSPLWGFNSLSFKKICTTWNIGVRSIFNLPYRAHTYFLGPLLQQPHISEQLYIRSAQFLYNMYNSHNSIVQTCFMNALYNSNFSYWFEDCLFQSQIS